MCSFPMATPMLLFDADSTFLPSISKAFFCHATESSKQINAISHLYKHYTEISSSTQFQSNLDKHCLHFQCKQSLWQQEWNTVIYTEKGGKGSSKQLNNTAWCYRLTTKNRPESWNRGHRQAGCTKPHIFEKFGMQNGFSVNLSDENSDSSHYKVSFYAQSFFAPNGTTVIKN